MTGFIVIAILIIGLGLAIWHFSHESSDIGKPISGGTSAPPTTGTTKPAPEQKK